jgi:hypothetical protein
LCTLSPPFQGPVMLRNTIHRAIPVAAQESP